MLKLLLERYDVNMPYRVTFHRHLFDMNFCLKVSSLSKQGLRIYANILTSEQIRFRITRKVKKKALGNFSLEYEGCEQ